MKYLTLTLISTVLLFATSCKKYEEGPLISLKLKKDRVENTWQISKAFDKGDDVTDSFDQYELYTTKDGDATLTATYTYGNLSFEFETNGTWEFTNSKENIKFDYEDDEADAEYQILKLKEDELHLRRLGDDLELQLKSK